MTGTAGCCARAVLTPGHVRRERKDQVLTSLPYWVSVLGWGLEGAPLESVWGQSWIHPRHVKGNL